MIAAAAAVESGRPAELGHANNQRLLEKSSLGEVCD